MQVSVQQDKSRIAFFPMAFEQPQKIEPKVALRGTPIVSVLTISDISLIRKVIGDVINPSTGMITDVSGQETSQLPSLATSIAVARMLHMVSGDITSSNFSNVARIAEDIKQPLSAETVAGVLECIESVS